MPPPARPIAPSQLSSTPSQGQGLTIDPVFIAPDFDVKTWINSVLDVTLSRPSSTATTVNSISAHASSLPQTSTNANASGAIKPSVSLNTLNDSDVSLDASLDLLQTPALDPVLDDGQNQADQDALLQSPSVSTTILSTSESQQQQKANTAAFKSHNAFLTQHATNYLTKLHLLANQTSTALSVTTQEMVKTLPRLIHELDQLRQETKTLQEGIQLVRSDINLVDSSETAQSLDRLKYLDLVKTRMEATHASLREAENWRNLEAEANEILTKGDFMRAAMRLSEAERSLVVYKNTIVEGDRMALLLALKDQLERQLMGKVKEALEQKDTALCQSLITAFGLISRQGKFQEYYNSQRRAPLLQQWEALVEAINISSHKTSSSTVSLTPNNAAVNSKDFLSVLHAFYKDASSMLRDEFAWISTIFSDPAATIHSLVQDIFTHIDPNMQIVLQHVGKSLGDEGSLPVWISAFSATESFGAMLERIVSQPLVGNQREHVGSRPRAGTLVQGADTKDGMGTHSIRSSIGPESHEIRSIHDPNEWAFILYEPFMPYQRDYGKLEGIHLQSLLIKSMPSMAPHSDNSVRYQELSKISSNLVKIMANANNIAFGLAEGAIGRCIRLTHGFGAPGLLDGINNFFKEIIDRYTEILLNCRQKAGLQVDETLSSQSKYDDRSRNPNAGLKYEALDDEEDEGEDSEGWDEDVSEQNQRSFQMGLRLMVLCRQLCLKLEYLDIKTKKALLGVEDLIKVDRASLDSDQQGSHHLSSTTSSMFDHGSSGSGARLAIQPPNASIALLQQSNLNSFRLQEILEIVKKSDLKEDQAVTGGLASDGVDRLSAETDLGLEPKPNHLYLQSHQYAAHLARLCQRFIFDSIYIPLVRPLSDIALLSCWTEGIDQQGQGDLRSTRRIHQSTLGGTRTDVIKFRSSPSDYMEELLRQLSGLPLTFDMYKGDLGLRFGIHLLPYADRPLDSTHRQDSTEQPSSAIIDGDEDGVVVDKVNGEDLSVGKSDIAIKEEYQDYREHEMTEEDDLTVMLRWITSLSRAAMHTLIERLYNPNQKQISFPAAIIPTITQHNRFAGVSSPALASSSAGQSTNLVFKDHYLSRLSDSGAKQLEIDLTYFVDNCLTSLGIKATPSIRALLKALQLSEAGLLMALQQVQEQIEEYHSSSSIVRSSSPLPSSSRTKCRRSFQTALELQHAPLVIPGAPVMPTVLVVAEEDIEGQLEVEKKVLEWVAMLKGIDILQLSLGAS
ncbi:Golgi complex component 7-domain-containing protein [Lobosporangium transversale]|uniref:Conserved oligomeric Golgi complex subunit 7 n=1 Tax=Lobosporangium transversale TaxID=64571 RepID=A0A1Y2GFV9_9FUNG|nr:Golgi complex component 7-domain-containing protein [Lobosporangium transversale]ORZ09690.1 Golgi complex component 7-domain-containing protein [Lobosporangium transversale]|eukprot:XP_021878960.1 Golgi complex component 7-domain-containing protein [Lobosporangium transversale]